VGEHGGLLAHHVLRIVEADLDRRVGAVAAVRGARWSMPSSSRRRMTPRSAFTNLKSARRIFSRSLSRSCSRPRSRASAPRDAEALVVGAQLLGSWRPARRQDPFARRRSACRWRARLSRTSTRVRRSWGASAERMLLLVLLRHGLPPLHVRVRRGCGLARVRVLWGISRRQRVRGIASGERAWRLCCCCCHGGGLHLLHRPVALCCCMFPPWCIPPGPALEHARRVLLRHHARADGGRGEIEAGAVVVARAVWTQRDLVA